MTATKRVRLVPALPPQIYRRKAFGMPRAAGMDVVIDPRRQGRLYDDEGNPLEPRQANPAE